MKYSANKRAIRGSMKRASRKQSHPFCPALGALLLNCLVSFCLNLGGAALDPSPAAAFISKTFDHKTEKCFSHHEIWRREKCCFSSMNQVSKTVFRLPSLCKSLDLSALLICSPYLMLILFVSVLKPEGSCYRLRIKICHQTRSHWSISCSVTKMDYSKDYNLFLKK